MVVSVLGLVVWEDLAIAEDIVSELNSGPLSDKDAKLPQGPGTFLIGKRQLDLLAPAPACPNRYRPTNRRVDPLSRAANRSRDRHL